MDCRRPADRRGNELEVRDQTCRKMDSAYLGAIAELENGGDEIHGYSGEKLKDVVVIRDVDLAHEESEV